ncbi:MAG: tRNA guanosine(34) transglycosylase Tgt [Microgenomates group bacterium]|nr:tRNA guanosine(34) transglycosylase Tgt [Microgenomates group bacterium]
MGKFFKLLYRSKKSHARVGEIKTSHGIIKTPAFVAVGTKGTIKTTFPFLLNQIKTQAAFVNTYHLVSHPGADLIQKAGGIHQWAKLNLPLMSDSGGFQVFSLASTKQRFTAKADLSENNDARHRVFSTASPGRLSQKQVFLHGQNKIRKADIRGEEEPLVIKISDDGVRFRSTYDGQLIEFTPEKSMEHQIKIGADIMMAFDECTYYPAQYKYARKAMERTHEWLKRCIKYFNNRLATPVLDSFTKVTKASSAKPPVGAALPLKQKQQFLYGIIQGATFEDLRKESAKFVVSQNTDGVAIGGVSVGESKKEMRDQVDWVADYLPADRPVHLLGVGQFDDILDLVGYGIDTFDCVEPTRLARMGRLYQISSFNFLNSHQVSNFKKTISRQVDIFKNRYKHDLSPVDENCYCYVCQNFSKSYLHHLFKQKEILAYNLATYHNLLVMERFFDIIRELIINNKI